MKMNNFNSLAANPQASEQILNAMFNQTAVGVAYISRDLQWLQVNQKLSQMVGYTSEELLGNYSLQAITHPQDRFSDRELLQQLLAGEMPNYAIEKRLLHKEGYLIWMNLNLSLLPQADADLPMLQLLVEDISDRKQLEDVIKALVKGTASVNGGADFFPVYTQYLAFALNVRHAMVTELIEEENNRRLRALGFWAGDKFIENYSYNLANTPCEKVVNEGMSCFRNNLQKLFPLDLDLVDINAHSYLGIPLLSTSNKLIGHMCIMDDKPLLQEQRAKSILTIFAARAAAELERKLAEEALIKTNEQLEIRVEERTAELAKAKQAAEVANEAKSTFLANMSHELRSPLNAILGFAQIMLRSRTLASEQVKNVGIITRSGEHLLNLINQVLDLSKIEAGRTTINDKNFDLYRLLDDVEDMFRLKADDAKLQLLFERTPDVPRYVRTDQVKLRQILINLLNNALKFTSEGGVAVRVKLASDQSQNTSCQIYFEVEDTGVGIPAKELEKLFEAFSQTAAGKQAQEGTGLGLAISRKFVQLMGGDITVSSEVGRGTAFKFDITVTIVDAKDVETQQLKRRVIALEPNQPRYRILIVDDKQINRQLLIELLNPLGFELKEASNGKEAVEIWHEWEPDLIWMDMRMPVMDGYEATQTIKSTTKGQATAIIALTASVLEEEKAVVLSSGCDDFLRKPFRTQEIFDAMHKHIGVRYIYEEPTDKPTSTPSKAEIKDVLTPEALATLPPELLTNLLNAARSSDIMETDHCLEEIRSVNAAIADALSALAISFEYGKIVSLIDQFQQ